MRLRAFLLLLLGVAGALPASAVAATAARVVSQTVGGDELLLAVAEPEQVAALSHLARDPSYSAVAEEAKAFPQARLGDAESILRFNPTLVLFADYSRGELVEQVRRAGVRTIIFDRYKTLDDAYSNLRVVAAALGREARAEAVIAECRARVAALARRLEGARRVRVIAPSTYGVIPGTDTTFQDLCDHAGAENLAATLGRLRGHSAPPVEQMLNWPIDRVVLAGNDPVRAVAVFRTIAPYQYMSAIREARVALIPSAQIACVSHHRIEGYEALARALHPEVQW